MIQRNRYNNRSDCIKLSDATIERYMTLTLASRSLAIRSLKLHGNNLEEALHDYLKSEDDDFVPQVIKLSLESEKEDEMLRLAIRESMKEQRHDDSKFNYVEQVSLSHETANEEKETFGLPRGMHNLGNSCYVNSILQCMTHTKPLMKIMGEHRFESPCYCGKTFCVQKALKTLMEDVLIPTQEPIEPENFVVNLTHFKLQPYIQEDAHDFLLAFWDKLELCCFDPRSSPEDQDQNNIVQKVFGGTLTNSVCCSQCGSSSQIKEVSLGYSLEIEGCESLCAALDSFTEAKRTEEKVCDVCKHKASRKFDYKFSELPPVATFHLKRFSYNTGTKKTQKIMKHVSFPCFLDMEPYVSHRETNEVSTKYRLYGFVVHAGTTMASGHYYSFTSSDFETWFCFNDREVSRVSSEDLLAQDPYILFYVREDILEDGSQFSQRLDSGNKKKRNRRRQKKETGEKIETQFENLSIQKGQEKEVAQTRSSNRPKQRYDLPPRPVGKPRVHSTKVWVKKGQSQRGGDGIGSGVKPSNA